MPEEFDAAALGPALRTELARRRLFDFCMRFGLQDARHTRYICDVLERVESGEIKRLIITTPPGHGKSTIVQNWSAWFLGRDPLRRLLTFSASEALAVRNSRAVRGLVQSDRWPWPEVTLSSDSSSVTAWETNVGNSVRAFGAGSTFMGFRCEAIVCDDIQADAGTDASLDALEAWFRSVLTGRLEPGGVAIMLQNRWTTSDIVARMLESDSGDQWVAINLEAICDDAVADPLQRQLGEALWPERWPVDVLLDRKVEVGGNVFASQYQGHPMPAGGRIFEASWFESRYDALPDAPQRQADPYDILRASAYTAARAPHLITITALDAAMKENVGGSRSALCTVATDGRNYYVTAVEAERVPFDQLLRMVVEHYNQHQPRAVIIEDAAMGSSAITELRNATGIPIIPVKPLGSKEARAMAIVPTCEAGRVLLPRRAPWLDEFLRELLAFPGGRHNDRVDAFVWALDYARRLSLEAQEEHSFRSQLQGGWMAR